LIERADAQQEMLDRHGKNMEDITTWTKGEYVISIALPDNVDDWIANVDQFSERSTDEGITQESILRPDRFLVPV